MKSNWSNRLVAVTTTVLLSLPIAALAQSSQGTAARSATTRPAVEAASPMADRAVAGKNAQERVEQRIKQLHSQLQITPAEQPQWDQFAHVMRENARDMDQAFMQRAQQFSKMSAVENMRSYEQIAEEHTQRLQKLIPAFESLYDAMPDQQKRLADQVFRENAERHVQRGAQRGRNG
jgi:protein CpxP